MSLEVLVVRWLAPATGTAVEVWGVVIAVVLGAMAAGYAGGGRLADRTARDTGLFACLAGSGAWLAAASLIAEPSIEQIALMPAPLGAAVGTTLLAAVPTALLAAVAPWAVRLSVRAEGDTGHVGATAGRVFAWGTVGSIAGVLLTSLVLLPRLGTRASLAGLSALTLVAGAAGFATARAAALGLVVASSSVLSWLRDPPLGPNVLWSGESSYHRVHVVDLGSLRGLVLDRAFALHSAAAKDGGWTGSYWDDFAAGPVLASGHRVLVLGMGAGASISAVERVDPRVDIDAVEIDPVVVEAAARFFDVHGGPRRRIHVADARRFLVTHAETWDVIQADVFRGPRIPRHLATLEFFELVRRRLAPGGVFMLNVFDASSDRMVLSKIASTLDDVFATRWVRSRAGNHVIFAFSEPRDLAAARGALTRRADADPALRPLADLAGGLEPLRRLVQPDGTGGLLTDDRSNLEILSRRAVPRGWR